MHTRDASGRRVSLLNDDSASYSCYQLPYRTSTSASYHQYATRRDSSSSTTPELLRSDSYDSQMSNEPMSPLTPVYDFRGYAAHEISTSYDDYADPNQPYPGSKRPSTFGDGRAASYDDDSASPASVDRSGKRYPCRFRDTHGCEKTFTTSGHASRHSKIHTAEKAVPCSFSGCAKKFTRADNMKQHLDTHYKEKSRTSSSRPSMSSSERRSSTSGKASSRTKSSSGASATSLTTSGGPWDMSGIDLPYVSRQGPPRHHHSSGLDALATIACQEGA
ncbi:hypothetical protein B0T25DRAFT_444854 [Lasiosphaeria hispida]|uniref:C2H2 type master regulator of conidiophore development brlA n=1 Tax=Lasiosphaeria hispida TaxID=260671 RepID=A0AAJ0HUC1_9PEZI|nr:hypothetical protein B0T25DRAFT_444854 [Lasiosphaeria hispida]